MQRRSVKGAIIRHWSAVPSSCFPRTPHLRHSRFPSLDRADVKRTSATRPVSMLTGWDKRLGAEENVLVEVDFILSKPPPLHELRQAVATVDPPR